MKCPKCSAKIGIMSYQIVHDTGVVNGYRCIMCGYWNSPDHPINLNHSGTHQNLGSER